MRDNDWGPPVEDEIEWFNREPADLETFPGTDHADEQARYEQMLEQMPMPDEPVRVVHEGPVDNTDTSAKQVDTVAKILAAVVVVCVIMLLVAGTAQIFKLVFL